MIYEQISNIELTAEEIEEVLRECGYSNNDTLKVVFALGFHFCRRKAADLGGELEIKMLRSNIESIKAENEIIKGVIEKLDAINKM